jgi:hypothetical protein
MSETFINMITFVVNYAQVHMRVQRDATIYDIGLLQLPCSRNLIILIVLRGGAAFFA